MFHHRPRIQAGDLVIVYEDFKSLHAVRVTPPQVFSSRFGKFSHAAMVGRRYGERMRSVSSASSSGGFIYLLSPSPELWTATLSHRTQILYVADISMICLQLELAPGSVVVEAGTGSGSLSHALARSVGSKGMLHTFEFNAERARLAAAEFSANGLDGRVICKHGDVCAETWSYAEHGEGRLGEHSVDAGFFDLPQPWDAVRRFAPYLRPGGRLCTFSPCIEQVARTMGVLTELGFTGVEVLETLVRTHDVRPPPRQEAQTLAQVVAQAARARKTEVARLEMAANGVGTHIAWAAASAVAGCGVEAAAGGVDCVDSVAGGSSELKRAADAQGSAPAGKRQKVDGVPPLDESSGGATSTPPLIEPEEADMGGSSGGVMASQMLRTRPNADMRGHTGFLVFCTKHVG